MHHVPGMPNPQQNIRVPNSGMCAGDQARYPLGLHVLWQWMIPDTHLENSAFFPPTAMNLYLS